MTSGRPKAEKRMSDVEVPAWWRDAISRSHEREFRDQITAEFLRRTRNGQLSPLRDVFIRCAHGHHMMFGEIALSRDQTRAFFVPARQFVDASTNGVWVWGNGNPNAVGQQQIIDSDLRLSLTCPHAGCDYRPEIQHSVLSAAVMASVLAGDLSPVLLF